MVGERAAGQEDSSLFTEHCRYPSLQPRDDAIPRELIRGDSVILGEAGQQERIFGGRQRHAIGPEVDAVILDALHILALSPHAHLLYRFRLSNDLRASGSEQW